MLLAETSPGRANQKSVPGLPHAAVTVPAEVCSASSPCAMVPLAWISTPAAWAVGLVLAGLVPFFAVPVPVPSVLVLALLAPVAAGTVDRVSAPGWVRVLSEVSALLPGVASRLTVARPVPVPPAAVPPAAAITASPMFRLPASPGPAQALVAELTAATV